GPGVGTPINQAAYNVRTMGNALQHVPPGPNVNIHAMPGYGYGGGGFYPSGYGAWGNSANGYLTGVASVIGAQGQFSIDHQQANLMNQQVLQAQQDTRKKIYQEWQWEQSQAPTLEEIRERDRKEALRRARVDPNNNDIWSGWALNQLLNDMEKAQGLGVQGPP